MVSPTLQRELLQQLEDLSLDQHRQVLNFANALAVARTRGVAGEKLLQFAGTIEPDDLKVISQAIEEDCEKIDDHGW